MGYEYFRRQEEEPEEPSLAEMVEKAIQLLSKQQKPFVLIVEGKLVVCLTSETSFLLFHGMMISWVSPWRKTGLSFLVCHSVSGGLIDRAHHNNYGRMALEETISLSEAVQRAVDNTSRSDTLIVVTADHGHAFYFGGYPRMDDDILGTAADRICSIYCGGRKIQPRFIKIRDIDMNVIHHYVQHTKRYDISPIVLYQHGFSQSGLISACFLL